MFGTASVLVLLLASAGAGTGLTSFVISLSNLRKQAGMTRALVDLWRGYERLGSIVATQAKLVKNARWMEERAEQLEARTESLAKNLAGWQEETRAIGREVATGAIRSAETMAMVESLPQVVERMITREEVSEAFAELARIEEQRLRQATARPLPSSGTPAGDPWAAPLSAAPADPQRLLQEITEMNARLRERLQQTEARP